MIEGKAVEVNGDDVEVNVYEGQLHLEEQVVNESNMLYDAADMDKITNPTHTNYILILVNTFNTK